MQRLQKEQLEDYEWDKVVIARDVLDEHIWIDDRSRLSIDHLRTHVQEMVQNHNIDLIIIDYVDLIQPEIDQVRHDIKGQDYCGLSRGLKIIARELNLPVIALAQISHKVRRFGLEPKVVTTQVS